MANFVRLLLGLAFLPACWGILRAFLDTVLLAAGAEGRLTAEVLLLLCGIAAFAVIWMVMPHPVRAYVLGHELTHALWGLVFGARPSDLRFGKSGGSVRLTKSNLLITLAPYFFPFYTFVVICVALLTFIFVRPLPCLPLWMFLIGFTWAFHILFTLETLTQRQPDIRAYGRLFSWTFVFLMNLILVMVWLAATTPLSFGALWAVIFERVCGAYSGTAATFSYLWRSVN